MVVEGVSVTEGVNVAEGVNVNDGVNVSVSVIVSVLVGVIVMGIRMGPGKSDGSRRRIKISSNTRFASISLSSVLKLINVPCRLGVGWLTSTWMDVVKLAVSSSFEIHFCITP